jgi:drug/metabolite transporter (DMT)-like permease
MTFRPHALRGYLYIASATFLWGIAATLGRAAFTGRIASLSSELRPLDPLILSQGRTTLSLLVLLPVLLARRGASSLAMPRRDIVRCVVLGVLGVAASNYFYYLSIQRTNVAVAIIIQYTAPVWVLLYMVSRGLQKPTLRRTASVVLAVFGCALVIGLVGSGRWTLDTVGVMAAVLASFSFAFYNVGGHKILTRYDRWKVLVWVLAGAALFWLIFNPPWKIVGRYSEAQWIFMFVFALVSVLGPFSCYFAGLQYLEPTSAIVVSCLEPVFSIIIAAIVLGEGVGPLQIVGIIVVLAATVLVQLPEKGSREELAILEPME